MSDVAKLVCEMSDELVNLATELNRWGAANKYPSIRLYPQYARLREIGQALFNCGSHRAMDHALAQIDESPELLSASVSRLIEFGWNGIGGWQA